MYVPSLKRKKKPRQAIRAGVAVVVQCVACGNVCGGFGSRQPAERVKKKKKENELKGKLVPSPSFHHHPR